MNNGELVDGPDDVAAVVVIEMVTMERWVPLSGWKPGPLPLPFVAYEQRGRTEMRFADREARSTYFYPRVAKLLYGGEGAETRWHLDLTGAPVLVGASTAIAAEIVTVPLEVRPATMLCIVHLHLPANDPIGALDEVVHVAAETAPLRLFLKDQLNTGITVAHGVRRARSLALQRHVHQPLTAAEPQTLEVATFERLWLLASATPRARFQLDPQQPKPVTTPMSASWRCLVLRDGIGFVGLTEQAEDTFLRDAAAVHVRSLYLDVLLIGEFQRIGFHDLAEKMSEVNWADGSNRLRTFERRMSTIRNAVWGFHLTQHAIADSILNAYQAQHRLPELLEEVQVELSDAARLADLVSSKRVEFLLTVLTVVASVSALVTVQLEHGSEAVVSTIIMSAALVLAVVLALDRPGRKSGGE